MGMVFVWFFSFLSYFLYALDSRECDVRRMENLMESAFKDSIFLEAKGKDVVLFLGKTQIGKSSIINYLLGCQYEKDGPRLKLKSGSVQEKAQTSDSFSAGSQTLFPEIYSSSGCPYYLCDTQGFGDTRGREEIIVSSILLEMVVSIAKSVRIVIPFTDGNLTDGAVGIRDFCKVLDLLLKDKTADFLFLFNSKNPCWTIHDVQKCLDALLLSETERLKQLGVINKADGNMVTRMIRSMVDRLSGIVESSNAEEHDEAAIRNFTSHPAVQDQIEKINTLWLIKRMSNACKRNKVIELDLTKDERLEYDHDDRPVSIDRRQEILDKIKELSPTDKKRFKFSNLTGDRPIFERSILKLMSAFRFFIELKKNFDRYEVYMQERIKHLENYWSYLEWYKDELEKKRREGVLFSQYTTSIEDEHRRIKTTEQDIENIKKEIQDARREIEKGQVSIASRDTDELVTYKEMSWNEDWAIFFGWWRNYKLEYVDFPYDYREESLDTNTKRVKDSDIEDKANGKFMAYYQSGWYSACKGTVCFKVKSRNHPAVVEEIKEERRKIEIEELGIQNREIEIKKREDRIVEIKKKIERIQRDGVKQLEDEIGEIPLKIERVKQSHEILERYRGMRKNLSIDCDNVKDRMKIWSDILMTLMDGVEGYNADIFRSFVNELKAFKNERIDLIPSEIECIITRVPSEAFLGFPCGHHISSEAMEDLYRHTPISRKIQCAICRQEFNRGEYVNKALCVLQYEDFEKHRSTLERYMAQYAQYLEYHRQHFSIP